MRVIVGTVLDEFVQLRELGYVECGQASNRPRNRGVIEPYLALIQLLLTNFASGALHQPTCCYGQTAKCSHVHTGACADLESVIETLLQLVE